MRSLASRIFLTLSAATCLADASAAQSTASPASPPPLPASDSIFRRARRLVSDGNGLAGRAVVDSMLRASAEGTPQYGDALFWRGALAETAADAERDYRKVVVEYPLSPYVDDALLSLAELEQARGDRTAAFQHLQRFVREHSVSPARARAGLAAARLAFEQRDMTRGCAMIADARSSAGASDVELRNQIDYYGGRCPATTTPAATPTAVAASSPFPATTAPAPTSAPTSVAPSETTSAPASVAPTAPTTSAASRARASTTSPKPTTAVATKPSASSTRAATAAATPKATPAKPPSVAAESTPPKTSTASRGTWTIQLAAYESRPDAERMVKKLSGRGVQARISGETKPFRVRLDFYPTRQAAAAAVAELKQRGIIGFVTEEARPSGAASQ